MAAPERAVEVAAYLAERYWPGLDLLTAREVMRGLAEHAGTDADSSTSLVACAFVPDEQALLVLVTADSSDDVADLGRRADVGFDRVVEAVVVTGSQPRAATPR
jgi:hypothetical protein